MAATIYNIISAETAGKKSNSFDFNVSTFLKWHVEMLATFLSYQFKTKIFFFFGELRSRVTDDSAILYF